MAVLAIDPHAAAHRGRVGGRHARRPRTEPDGVPAVLDGRDAHAGGEPARPAAGQPARRSRQRAEIRRHDAKAHDTADDRRGAPGERHCPRAHRAVRSRPTAGRRRAADWTASTSADRNHHHDGQDHRGQRATGRPADHEGAAAQLHAGDPVLAPGQSRAVRDGRRLRLRGEGAGSRHVAAQAGGDDRLGATYLVCPASTGARAGLRVRLSHYPYDRAVAAQRHLVDQLRHRHKQSLEPVRFRPRQPRRDPLLRRAPARPRRRPQAVRG